MRATPCGAVTRALRPASLPARALAWSSVTGTPATTIGACAVGTGPAAARPGASATAATATAIGDQRPVTAGSVLSRALARDVQRGGHARVQRALVLDRPGLVGRELEGGALAEI